MARTEIEAGSQIQGILPVADGGTGANTLSLGAVLVGNGTGTVTQVASVLVGNVLTDTGSGFASMPAPSGGGDPFAPFFMG
jgi:hypothetical protein